MMRPDAPAEPRRPGWGAPGERGTRNGGHPRGGAQKTRGDTPATGERRRGRKGRGGRGERKPGRGERGGGPPFPPGPQGGKRGRARERGTIQKPPGRAAPQGPKAGSRGRGKQGGQRETFYESLKDQLKQEKRGKN